MNDGSQVDFLARHRLGHGDLSGRSPGDDQGLSIVGHHRVAGPAGEQSWIVNRGNRQVGAMVVDDTRTVDEIGSPGIDILGRLGRQGNFIDPVSGRRRL